MWVLRHSQNAHASECPVSKLIWSQNGAFVHLPQALGWAPEGTADDSQINLKMTIYKYKDFPYFVANYTEGYHLIQKC